MFRELWEKRSGLRFRSATERRELEGGRRGSKATSNFGLINEKTFCVPRIRKEEHYNL